LYDSNTIVTSDLLLTRVTYHWLSRCNNNKTYVKLIYRIVS